jgi:hypothetical protein
MKGMRFFAVSFDPSDYDKRAGGDTGRNTFSGIPLVV